MDHEDHAAHGYDKDAIRKRLARIEGQVRGIARMVDDMAWDHASVRACD